LFRALLLGGGQEKRRPRGRRLKVLVLQLGVESAREADGGADEVGGREKWGPLWMRGQERSEGDVVAQVEGANRRRDRRGLYVEEVGKGPREGEEGIVEGVRDGVRESG
jgi:hypothetical protein